MVRKEKKTNSQTRTKKNSPGKAVEFRLSAPEAEVAYFAGEFNGWDPLSLPMKKGSDGIWKAKTKLMPGRYEYKVMAGQFWVEDLPGVEMEPMKSGDSSRNARRSKTAFPAQPGRFPGGAS